MSSQTVSVFIYVPMNVTNNHADAILSFMSAAICISNFDRFQRVHSMINVLHTMLNGSQRVQVGVGITIPGERRFESFPQSKSIRLVTRLPCSVSVPHTAQMFSDPSSVCSVFVKYRPSQRY